MIKKLIISFIHKIKEVRNFIVRFRKKIKVILVWLCIIIITSFPTAELFPALLTALFGDDIGFTGVYLGVLFLVVLHAIVLFYLLNWEYRQGKYSYSKKIVYSVQNNRFLSIFLLNSDRHIILQLIMLVIIALIVLRYGVFVVATRDRYGRIELIELIVLFVGILLKVYLYTLLGQGLVAATLFIIKKIF